jgi:hypothetical protein
MMEESLSYQIKVTLNGIKPPIWRRLVVPSSIPLKDLHNVLQLAFGWSDSHLHQFCARRIPLERSGRVRLDEILRTEKDVMTYEYDFGDGWEHSILLEKVLGPAKATDRPSCIEGARAGPPEDCGGVWGYAELLKVVSDPSHPEHGRMLEWVGPDFDPEQFDISGINNSLARVKRRGLTTRSRATGRKRPAP